MLHRPGRCVSKPRDFRRVPNAVASPSRKLEVHLHFKGLGPPSPTVPSLRDCLKRASRVARELSIVSGMAGRYASALFELALEEHALDAVNADLERFDALIDESADLRRLVRSPTFTAETQSRALAAVLDRAGIGGLADRKSTRLNSSHLVISYAVFCLKKKKINYITNNNTKKTKKNRK